MQSKLIAHGSALLLFVTLTLAATAQQENPAEEKHEQQIDRIEQANASHEPHMSAALKHLREAQEELEKATPNKGGHRERAMELTKQAQSQIISGMYWYNENVLHQKKK